MSPLYEPGAKAQRTLGLKAGEWVEVRGREEILKTLDAHGRLDNLPFMPEMFQYCGKRFRVFKRADKTCDYIEGWSIRRMKDSVHLEGLRCDGSAHGGCQASCLIFWKEAWLKRAASGVLAAENSERLSIKPPKSGPCDCTVEMVLAATHTTNTAGETIYSCQATEVPKFTSRMSFWDPRQYLRDLRSGNLKSGFAGPSRGHRLLDLVLSIARLVQASIVGYYNQIQDRRSGSRYPFIEGTVEKTPNEVLNLQQAELVEVRSKEEIMATLGKDQRNRGLWFDSEMLPYCGGIYRVLKRVNHLVDEKTGKLINMKNSCIILEGVVCRSDFHRLCPRAIYPYWRETWLKRAMPAPPATAAEGEVEEDSLRRA